MAAITRLTPPRANSISLINLTPAMRALCGLVGVAAGALLGVAAGLGASQAVLVMGLLTPFVLMVVLARPYWATVVYLILVYTDLLSILVKYHGMPPLARFAGVALLSAVLGYRLIVQRERLVGDRVTLWMLAYGAMVVAGLLYARAPDLVMSNVIEFTRNLFTYLIVINTITTSARLYRALYALLIAGVALGSLTIFQTVTGQFDNDFGGFAQYRVSDIAGNAEAPRPSGTIGDANYYGQLILIALPIALYLMFEGRSRLARLAGLASAAIITAAVVLTYSRGDAVALGAVIVAAVIYKRPNPLLLVGAVVALLVALPLLPSNYLARLTTVIDVAEGNQQTIYSEDSIRGRAGATQAAIEMFADHPLFGVGRENYPLYQLEYLQGTGFAEKSYGIPPHNLYLEVAAEHGVMGIIIVGGFLLAIWQAAIDARKRFRLAGAKKESALAGWLAIMLIGYLVSALSLHGAFLYMLWLQIALIVSARQISRSYYVPMEVTQPQLIPVLSTQARARTAGGQEQSGNIVARAASAVWNGASAVRGKTSAWAGEGMNRLKKVVAIQGKAEQASTKQTGAMLGQIVGPGSVAAQTNYGQASVAGSVSANTSWRDSSESSDSMGTDVWLAAAEAALQRGDVKVARAMVEMALERNPYSARAWDAGMRVRRAEQRSREQGASSAERDFSYNRVAEAAARSAFEAAANAGGEGPQHEVSEKLYDFWYGNGGVPVFGYPISPRFAEIGINGEIIEVQYFERTRLEYHPNREGIGGEIVTGKLGLEAPSSGAMAVQLPPGLDNEQVVFTLNSRGISTPRKFFNFWESNGGPSIFGYPITPVLIDTDATGRQIAVQYFEKARLEYHHQLAGTVYEVQVSRLGALVFARRYGR